MSERPIQKGDLVVAVRGHECMLAIIGGIPFTVNDLVPQTGGGWYCKFCNQFDIAPEGKIAAQGVPGHPNGSVPLSWLIRIDPPATGDTLPTRADAGIKERV